MCVLPADRRTISRLTPAKLNLLLKITGKRKDGYHLLYTLFHKISIYDKLTIRLREEVGIRLIVPAALSDGPDNLVHRAACGFMAATGIKAGLEISLEKNIPMGGGLGGGSSDAATTLRMLNTLFLSPLSTSRLHEIASGIGADVPFFLIDDSSAIGTGTGTELKPVDFPAFSFLLLLPDFGVSTAWAYSRCSVSEDLPEDMDFVSPDSRFLWQNDLEKPVFERYPLLMDVKKRLVDAGAMEAMMSGSGSTMFGVFGTRKEAEKCARTFPLPEGWGLTVAGSV